MKKAVPVIVLILAAAAAVYYFLILPSDRSKTEIKTSGHVEATEVDMSFRLPGHVGRLYVDEGARVKKGEIVAELEQDTLSARHAQASALVRELETRQASLAIAIDLKERLLDADIRRAQAGRSAASARYQSLKSGSREQEIAEAKAAMDRARYEWENRSRDAERLKEPYQSRIISPSQYDTAVTATDSAKAAYLAASERYKLVKAGPREELVMEGKAQLEGTDAALEAAEAGRMEIEKLKLDLKALEAQTDQARAQLSIASDDLDKSRLRAPFEAFVTVKDVEEHEYVQPGTPVVTLARLDEVWVKTYVPETQLSLVKLGQEAEVISDTFPAKRYPGRVTFISPQAEFTPKNVQTKEERVKLVFRIKVTLKNPDQELKPGLPVDVILKIAQ